MTAHELAHKLLQQPDLMVMLEENCGYLLEFGSVFVRTINQQDEDLCGAAEGRVGETVVIVTAF